ncbi:hypothetical protein GY45DRAFT_988090 [Cubamyces sp. BRFM 1775]|nr:hypothetical protein GY45DRAFT_988090 [Cubamyces sp. BRFM 1775]
MAASVVSQLFNRADADIVLRSSDNVDFRLHKLILGMASPIFSDMLTLPDLPGQGEQPQVVEVQETATTLEGLLPFCYPMVRPVLLHIDHLQSVLRAAEKYEMTFISSQLLCNLRLFLPAEPLRVYATACMREDADLARVAVKVLLGRYPLYDPHDPPPEFDYLPAIALAKFEAYRMDCATAARSVLLDLGTMPSGFPSRSVSVSRKGNVDTSNAWIWLACRSCDGGSVQVSVSNAATGHGQSLTAWWQEYSDMVAKELELRPLASVVTETRFIRPAIARAAECKTCGPRAAVHLTEYAEAMAKKIEDALSKVVLVLPFHQTEEGLEEVYQPAGVADLVAEEDKEE